MIQRYNVCIMVPIWLVVAASLSMMVAAFDIRFLNANTNPTSTHLSRWRSKRLTTLACHCCSNSFNSRCCLQCLQRSKRGTTTMDMSPKSEDLQQDYPSKDSWSNGGTKSFYDSLHDSPDSKTLSMWNYGATEIPPRAIKNRVEGISKRSLLERSRACSHCLKASRSRFVMDMDVVTSCAKCQGTDDEWGVSVDLY